MAASNIPLAHTGNRGQSSSDDFFNGQLKLEVDHYSLMSNQTALTSPGSEYVGQSKNRAPLSLRAGSPAEALLTSNTTADKEHQPILHKIDTAQSLFGKESSLERLYHLNPDNVDLHRHHLATHHGDMAHQHTHDDEHKPTSKFHTFVNLIKGNIGTGILSLPYAMKHAGLAAGTIGLILVGLLCTYCMHQLLSVYRIVLRKRPGREMDYADVVEACFKDSSSPFFNKLSRISRHSINTFLVITQFGVCVVYLNFSTGMIYDVMKDNFHFTFPFWMYQAVISVFLIPTAFVRRLNVLAIFSTVANFMTIGVLCVIMQHVFRNLQDYRTLPLVTANSGFFLYFGSVMFAFESVTFVLPFEMKMKDRVSFHYWDGLMSLAMVTVIALYAAVAFYGYLAFGEDSKLILLNMPDHWIYYSLKLIYAICIILSFSLQMFIPVQILWPPLRHSMRNNDFVYKFGEYFLRTLWVIIVFFLAATVPCLEEMISLVGTFAMSALALIFPAVIEIVVNVPVEKADVEKYEMKVNDNGKMQLPKTAPKNRVVSFPDDDEPPVGHAGFVWICIKCSVIILIGFGALIVGTWVVINGIKQSLDEGKCWN